MNKESAYQLQLIDCNCNDCLFMKRDQVKLAAHKASYKGTGLMDRLNFGLCRRFKKPVSFIPVTCQIETQKCFRHKKQPLIIKYMWLFLFNLNIN